MVPPRVFDDELKTYLPLDQLVGDGGQGYVLSVTGDPGVVVKVWKDGEAPEYPEFTLEAIKAATATVPGVCPILSTVRAWSGGPVIGYRMPLIKGTSLTDYAFKTTAERVRCARLLAELFVNLRKEQAYIGDGHTGNVIRSGGWLPCPVLIDTDSLSFDEMVWPDGTKRPRHLAKMTEEYGAPEFFGQASVTHTEQSVSHTLGVLLFRVLKSNHPATVLNRQGNELPLGSDQYTVGSISKGWWGRFLPNALPPGHTVPDAGIPWNKLPVDLRWLFTQTFARGLGDPGNRPLLEEWLEALRRWEKRLYMQWTAVGLAVATVFGIFAYPMVTKMWSRASAGLSAPVSPVITATEPATTDDFKLGSLWTRERR